MHIEEVLVGKKVWSVVNVENKLVKHASNGRCHFLQVETCWSGGDAPQLLF
jgi:hypothetical protein